jgi:hypothetical protein
MEKSINKMFVNNWTDEKVQCEMIEEKTIREFDRQPLFQGMKLFRGKNVCMEITVVPSTMTCSNFESKKHKLVQLYNYWVRGKF